MNVLHKFSTSTRPHTLKLSVIVARIFKFTLKLCVFIYCDLELNVWIIISCTHLATGMSSVHDSHSSCQWSSWKRMTQLENKYLLLKPGRVIKTDAIIPPLSSNWFTLYSHLKPPLPKQNVITSNGDHM